MKKLILVIVFLLFCSTAQATLIDRGGGLIYDSVLNIIWLQDAQYCAWAVRDGDSAPIPEPSTIALLGIGLAGLASGGGGGGEEGRAIE